MRAHSITMLGTALIGDFYTATLHGQRGRDRVQIVYSRTEEGGKAFSQRCGEFPSTPRTRRIASTPDEYENKVVKRKSCLTVA